jgi:long-chain fatty acid transport protein
MKQIYSFYLFLGLFLIPVVSFSQGFQVNFQGQKQQAMGCAGTALQTDGASLFFNPGASAFAKENSVNIATTPIFANVMYVDSATNDVYRTENPVGTPFSAYGLFQLKEDGKLKLGIAAYTPFGSTVQWEKNWIGRFAITRLELKAIFIQPTISYRISDKIGVGAGFIYSTGNVNLQKDIPVQFEDGTFAKAELAGKAQGFGYNLGVQINATEKLGIGLNFRSKVQMNLNDGKATFTVPSGLDPNFPDGKFVGGLPYPLHQNQTNYRYPHPIPQKLLHFVSAVLLFPTSTNYYKQYGPETLKHHAQSRSLYFARQYHKRLFPFLFGYMLLAPEKDLIPTHHFLPNKTLPTTS